MNISVIMRMCLLWWARTRRFLLLFASCGSRLSFRRRSASAPRRLRLGRPWVRPVWAASAGSRGPPSSVPSDWSCRTAPPAPARAARLRTAPRRFRTLSGSRLRSRGASARFQPSPPACTSSRRSQPSSPSPFRLPERLRPAAGGRPGSSGPLCTAGRSSARTQPGRQCPSRTAAAGAAGRTRVWALIAWPSARPGL